MKKLIRFSILLFILCLSSICLAGSNNVNMVFVDSGGGECASDTSEMGQSTSASFMRGVDTDSIVTGQSITVGTQFNLSKITVNFSNLEDATIELRVGTNEDLATYTESITGTYSGTAQQDVTFTSVTNPLLTTGTWYFAVRVISGTITSGWTRGNDPGGYSGGTLRYGGGGTQDWNLQFGNTEDIAFEVFKCD